MGTEAHQDSEGQWGRRAVEIEPVGETGGARDYEGRPARMEAAGVVDLG